MARPPNIAGWGQDAGDRRGRGRGFFFRLARHYTPIVVSDVGTRTYYVHARDRSSIGLPLFRLGERADDREDLAQIRALLDAHGQPTHPTFIDIGANIGTSTIEALASGMFAEAVAVEPDSANYHLLTQNLHVNELADHVRTLDVAISDHDGAATLALGSEDSLGDYRLQDDLGHSTAVVRTMTFDSFVQQCDVDLETVGLVWIDTQVHEGHVLSGARSLVEAGIPTFAEFWPAGMRDVRGYERFLEHAATGWLHFAAMDAWMPARAEPRLEPIDRLAALRRALPVNDQAHTNVLLLRLHG